MISVKHPGQIVLFRFLHTSLAEGKASSFRRLAFRN